MSACPRQKDMVDRPVRPIDGSALLARTLSAPGRVQNVTPEHREGVLEPPPDGRTPPRRSRRTSGAGLTQRSKQLGSP
jgi:hypothetical protein